MIITFQETDVDMRFIQFELRNFKHLSQKSVIVIFAQYI